MQLNRGRGLCALLTVCLTMVYYLHYTQREVKHSNLETSSLVRVDALVAIRNNFHIQQILSNNSMHSSSSYTTSVVTKETKPMWVNMDQEFRMYPPPYGTREYEMNVSNFKYKILMYYHAPWTPMLDLSDCNYGNCAMTKNRDQLSSSDAALFNIGESIPDDVIAARPKNQIWIFYTLEPPYKIGRSNNTKNVFNWSLTYRSDSDIPHPYGVLKQRQKPLQRNYHEIFLKKTKLVAWIVSNCNVPSQRHAYVKLLQKYIPVDIYGHCGKKLKLQHEHTFTGESLIRDTLREYKFYLSFENSLCEDYISEKLFLYLKMDVVLVARGGADYKTLIPTDTIINTADFKTVEDLANYLKMLNANESEYVKYLKKIDRYEINYFDWPWKNSLCNLCRRLNNREEYKQTYNDPSAWFINGQCKSPLSDLIESNVCARHVSQRVVFLVLLYYLAMITG